MKVHNKGQVVIPAAIRKELGIDIGDLLEVEIDLKEQRIELRKPAKETAHRLAGSLRQYSKDKPFPSRKQMHRILQQGLGRDA